MNISLPKLSINLLYCVGLISEKTNKNISGISTISKYSRECISNGYTTLPVDHKMCFSKKDIHLNYKPKNELARTIAIEAKKQLPFLKSIVGDAHFYSKESIMFYNENNINFDFRIHSNRKIILENGKETSIKNHFINKFKGSKIRKNKSIICYIKDIKSFKVCIIRIFRSKDYDCEPIYIISNYLFNDIRPHIKAIKTRWNI